METNYFAITPLEISFEKVLARLGYPRFKATLDKTTENIIRTEIQLAKNIVAPKYVVANSYLKMNVPDEVSLDPCLVIKSKDIYLLLKNCTQAFGFATTIGPHLEEKRDFYIKEKQATRALVLDAIGSVAAAESAGLINHALKNDAAKKSLTLTHRFSPGYGDWNIKGQKEFLRWLGAEKIGIRLEDGYQMFPEKSVSAIIGVKQI